MRTMWSRIGLVPQKPYLFSGTIASNLRYGDPDATDDDLWRALEDADAAAMVRALPEGLETIVGERGARLSGGEGQRIALARALLRRPALLVLDEPTSALDAASEARVIATIQRLKGRHTIVIVAHREALAASADQTIALDRGRIVRPVAR
jgi:ABC-type multidrug transport system fused ATPase/permease subunit